MAFWVRNRCALRGGIEKGLPARSIKNSLFIYLKRQNRPV
jgi:hypothetical protein